MLERAERGLPVVEPVIELLDAVQLGVRLKGLSDFEHTLHPGGVQGGAKLVEGLCGTGAQAASGLCWAASTAARSPRMTVCCLSSAGDASFSAADRGTSRGC